MFASVEAQTKLPYVPKYVIRLSNKNLASVMVNCPFFMSTKKIEGQLLLTKTVELKLPRTIAFHIKT